MCSPQKLGTVLSMGSSLFGLSIFKTNHSFFHINNLIMNTRIYLKAEFLDTEDRNNLDTLGYTAKYDSSLRKYYVELMTEQPNKIAEAEIALEDSGFEVLDMDAKVNEDQVRIDMWVGWEDNKDGYTSTDDRLNKGRHRINAEDEDWD